MRTLSIFQPYCGYKLNSNLIRIRSLLFMVRSVIRSVKPGSHGSNTDIAIIRYQSIRAEQQFIWVVRHKGVLRPIQCQPATELIKYMYRSTRLACLTQIASQSTVIRHMVQPIDTHKISLGVDIRRCQETKEISYLRLCFLKFSKLGDKMETYQVR